MRAKKAARRGRRAAILVAARRVLAEKGLEATTISEIVSQARVAQGTFYLYFSSKFAMVYALAEQMLERVLVAVHKEALKATSFSETVEFGLSATFPGMGDYAYVYAILNNGGGLGAKSADRDRLFDTHCDLMPT